LAKNVYETLFILDSNKYARDPNGVSGSVADMVQKCGGEVLASRLWNEQKLAYPVDGHRKGTYWLCYFSIDSKQLSTWNRQCQLNEAVVRQLTLRVDPRLVDVLVQHALGVATRKPRDGELEAAAAAGEEALAE